MKVIGCCLKNSIYIRKSKRNYMQLLFTKLFMIHIEDCVYATVYV